MKLEKQTISILKHLGTFAKSVHIEPCEPQILVAAEDQKRIVAIVRNIQSFEDEMPIYEIKNFVSALELFKDTDFSIEVSRESAEIKSDDGVYNQNYLLADPAILITPKRDKTELYFAQEVEVEFELTDALLSKLKSGVSQNNASTILFENLKGQIVIRATNVAQDGRVEKTTNQFSIKTSHTSSVDFRVGVPASAFTQVAPGDYKLGITKNFIRLVAPADAHVSYILPTQKWSQYN